MACDRSESQTYGQANNCGIFLLQRQWPTLPCPAAHISFQLVIDREANATGFSDLSSFWCDRTAPMPYGEALQDKIAPSGGHSGGPEAQGGQLLFCCLESHVLVCTPDPHHLLLQQPV